MKKYYLLSLLFTSTCFSKNDDLKEYVKDINKGIRKLNYETNYKAGAQITEILQKLTDNPLLLKNDINWLFAEFKSHQSEFGLPDNSTYYNFGGDITREIYYYFYSNLKKQCDGECNSNAVPPIEQIFSEGYGYFEYKRRRYLLLSNELDIQFGACVTLICSNIINDIQQTTLNQSAHFYVEEDDEDDD